MDGFGQWEFLGLLGVTLQGEAQDVHTACTEHWDLDLTYGEANRRARCAEGRRVMWRGYRKQKAAWATMRLNSSLTAQPVEELEDLEEFFHALTQRFRMSTTQNLSLLHSFKVRPKSQWKASLHDSTMSCGRWRQRSTQW